MKNEIITNPNDFIEEQQLIQLIVFVAGYEEFGVAIDSVREIIKMGPITSIPDSPGYIKGIINVRGEIATTIDLKKRFSLPSNKNNEIKHIIVTKQVDGLYGLMVDEVIEVLRIKKSEIKPPPSLVTKIHKKYISGVLSHNNRLIIILNLIEVISQNDVCAPAEDAKKKKSTTKSKKQEVLYDDRENKG